MAKKSDNPFGDLKGHDPRAEAEILGRKDDLDPPEPPEPEPEKPASPKK